MPKPVLVEHRFDFRGGRNVAVSPDLLNPNELVNATNARLQTSVGAIAKRTGTRRMQPSAFGDAVRGIRQWDAPGGKQLVAIAEGDLWYKSDDFGSFTRVNPGTNNKFSTTEPAFFMTFRDKTSGAPLNLYIASGGRMYKWTGSTLTRIDGTNSVPAGYLIEQYHTRAFSVDVSTPKTLSWSKVGLGDDYGIGGISDGGSAMVDTLTGDAILAIRAIGGSLVVATADSISRYTGYSSDDIQLAQDTEGISSDVGIVGLLALERVEKWGFGISDRGPYVISESGVQAVGAQIEPDLEDMNRAQLHNVVVGHHRARREIWVAYTPAGGTGNTHVLVWNYRLQAWYGPFIYPFAITYFARYQTADGSETLISGAADGRVRLMDTGALDDVSSTGTGGSPYTMTAELAPIFFSSGPGVMKSLPANTMSLQADLPVASALNVGFAFDEGSFTDVAVTGAGNGVQPYRVDAAGQGGRLRIRFTDASAEIPIIHGFSIRAFNMNRPA